MNPWLSHRQGRPSCRGNGRAAGRFCKVWQNLQGLTRWGLRGPWQAIVHGVARVGHDLATKPPPLRCAISSLGKTKRRNPLGFGNPGVSVELGGRCLYL